MVHPQTMVHMWGPEQGFWPCFVDGLNQKFSFAVVQAIKKLLLAKRWLCHVQKKRVTSVPFCDVMKTQMEYKDHNADNSHKYTTYPSPRSVHCTRL